MADTYRRYPFVSRHRSDANFISGCLRLQLIAIASLGILTLYADKLLAATWSKEEFRSQEQRVRSRESEVGETGLGHDSAAYTLLFERLRQRDASLRASLLLSETLRERASGGLALPLGSQEPGVRSQKQTIKGINIDTQTSCKLNSPSSCILTPDFCILTPDSCILTPLSLKSKPFLIAAPENFNPGMRIPPPPPPKPKPPLNSSPKPTSTQPIKPIAILENIQTDYRYDTDNFGQRNLFIEPTAEFRLSNGNKIKLKTGFDYFEQRGVESITNIPLQVGWSGKLGEVTLQTAAGIDVFDRLPTAVNLNAKVEAPILRPKVSPSGKLQSLAILSGNLEHRPQKFNARTLENQITAWRFGPDLYWQIDRYTSLFSSLRLGNYNDGNSEVQSFSRLERKIGQFSVAANLFTWSFQNDFERKSGYFSPPDFLVYNAEVAWEGDISKFLRCRLAANFGRQRLKGEFDNANTYQSRCTVKFSPNVEVDLGYNFSNVRNQETGGSTYSGNSLTGQLRVKF